MRILPLTYFDIEVVAIQSPDNYLSQRGKAARMATQCTEAIYESAHKNKLEIWGGDCHSRL